MPLGLLELNALAIRQLTQRRSTATQTVLSSFDGNWAPATFNSVAASSPSSCPPAPEEAGTADGKQQGGAAERAVGSLCSGRG
eukprot:g14323.t1